MSKGSRIGLEGRIQVRSYDAQDGSKRYVTEIVANEIEFLSAKNATQPAGGYGAPAPMAQPGGEQSFGPDLSDEEIPF